MPRSDQPNEASDQFVNARNTTWLGRSTVRTVSACHRFQLTDGLLDTLAGSANQAPLRSTFVTTAVIGAGINNLPKELSDKVAASFEEGGVHLLPALVDPAVRTQVPVTGYANAVEAIRADVPWRPAPIPRPVAAGHLRHHRRRLRRHQQSAQGPERAR